MRLQKHWPPTWISTCKILSQTCGHSGSSWFLKHPMKLEEKKKKFSASVKLSTIQKSCSHNFLLENFPPPPPQKKTRTHTHRNTPQHLKIQDETEHLKIEQRGKPRLKFPAIGWIAHGSPSTEPEGSVDMWSQWMQRSTWKWRKKNGGEIQGSPSSTKEKHICILDLGVPTRMSNLFY